MASRTDSIPPCDPHAGYQAQKGEIESAILRVLQSGAYILGEEVAAFEREFASYIGSSNAVGVANGTDALQLAMLALGIGDGDGVFTVSHTAVATVAAIERVGAVPLLVDIDPVSYTMCPQSLSDAIRAAGGKGISSKAIIPVHLYGHPANMFDIMQIAKANALYVIEDCSQSHGAKIAGRTTGRFGDLAAFSLYPTKNLGAYGDAGIITTDSTELAERLRALRQYGWYERSNSEFPGTNSRLDELQAAVLRVRLRRLEEMNNARRRTAAIYSRELSDVGIRLPLCPAMLTHVYHQYVVRSSQRDDLRRYLGNQGIVSAVHYPRAVHQQTAYVNRLPNLTSLAATENVVTEILSLPMYPELREDEVNRVIQCVKEFSAINRSFS